MSGNKSGLIKRIISSTGLIRSDAEHPVLEILREKWFMSPLGLLMAMREGVLNEANVLPKLGLSLQNHSENDCRLQWSMVCFVEKTLFSAQRSHLMPLQQF